MSCNECNETRKELIREESLKDILSNELERLGTGGSFVWAIFFLCVTPNILNGFHVSSYTLLGHLPDDQWCEVANLRHTNWTADQRRLIAQEGLTTQGCTIWDWNYEHLSTMTFASASNYTADRAESSPPAEIPCTIKGRYGYKAAESTFVADWDLVCERALMRTSAQMFISLGKFLGSFTFGILADKYGRKFAFTMGAIVFVTSSLFCTFSPWYSLFLVGRFGLGAASSGLFYPAFTIVVENVCLKHRSWMSIAFAASYPIGIVVLALAAYLLESWRHLQLALTVPAFLLIVNCYLLNESPRWLISQKRYEEAYQMLFKKKFRYQIENTPHEINYEKHGHPEKHSLWTNLKEGPLKQIIELFATSKVRKLIFTSYFMFCVTSLSYYVTGKEGNVFLREKVTSSCDSTTALNAANLSVSRFLYVAITGMVDIPSYLVPIIMLRCTGRRITTMSLFAFTGVALLMVLLVPAESTSWIVSFAMMGRFGISATYSIVTLYTAELYPTEIRNSALGTCSTWAHVGSITAPYVVDILGLIGWYIPTTICGCCVLMAALLTLTLPETATQKLSDCLEEVPAAAARADVQKVAAISSDK